MHFCDALMAVFWVFDYSRWPVTWPLYFCQNLVLQNLKFCSPSGAHLLATFSHPVPDFDSKIQNSLTCNRISWLFPHSWERMEFPWLFPDRGNPEGWQQWMDKQIDIGEDDNPLTTTLWPKMRRVKKTHDNLYYVCIMTVGERYEHGV